jgi:hypothetical protein
MATSKKKPPVRFKDPDEKYLGSEPFFDSSLGDNWPGRNLALMRSLNWYNHFAGRKDFVQDLYEYAKTVLKLSTKDLSDFKLGGTLYTPSAIGALVRMGQRGFIMNQLEKDKVRDAIMDTVEHGKKIRSKEVQTDSSDGTTPTAVVKAVTITPQQRLKNKVNSTIMEDLRVLEDSWITGESYSLDVYERMKTHELPAMATGMVTPWVSDRIKELQDAADKSCSQAVEAFRHLSKKEISNRIKILNTILDDLKRHQSNSKTVRKTRAKKPVAATKQVAKIKFLKESPEFKLVSINPANVVGAMRLFVFNVKTRTLSEYVSSSPNGLTVKGTTLQNWDESVSRSKKLRTPEDFLPLVLSKTSRQIENAWKKLTTKDSSPNGRLNEDTILMRTLNG